MKHNLGKYFFLLTILFALIDADDFRFTPHINTTDPYVKEPVLLSIDLNQTNHNVVMLFNFDLKPSPHYIFRRIDSKRVDNYHDAKVHYLYLVFPLKSGAIKIDFDLVKRITNDESVTESFAGDRDTVKFLKTKNSKVDIPSLTLHVKPLPKGTQLIGDFKLDFSFKKTHANAYEPIPFQITISGKGYPPLIEHLIKENGQFTLFSEKPIVKSHYTETGIQSSVTYSMALSAKENFILPSIAIKAFDPKKERSYTLTIPKTTFTIKKPDVNTLVDRVDIPETYRTDWHSLVTLMGYLIVFGAGFSSGWLLRWQKHTHNNTIHPLIEKIEGCKEKKVLLQLLLAHDAVRFAPVINTLETDLYGKEKTSLKTLKQKAKEQLYAG